MNNKEIQEREPRHKMPKLSLIEIQILAEVRNADVLSAKVLTQEIFPSIQRNTVYKIIYRFVDHGFLEKTGSSERKNSRAIYLRITPRGKEELLDQVLSLTMFARNMLSS